MEGGTPAGLWVAPSVSLGPRWSQRQEGGCEPAFENLHLASFPMASSVDLRLQLLQPFDVDPPQGLCKTSGSSISE